MSDIDNGDIERVMWENSLAFFGAITASVSHELNNVMSIIDQNNGLLKDLLAVGHPISNERLERINNSITAALPTKPSSSPMMAKMKSVVSSGRCPYLQMPLPRPFPLNPPEPRAISDWFG